MYWSSEFQTKKLILLLDSQEIGHKINVALDDSQKKINIRYELNKT